MKHISLKSIAKDYRELCYDEDHTPMLWKQLGGVVAVNVQSPYIYAGRVENVRMFGRSFVHHEDGNVFHCQSYQNHNHYAWETTAEYYLKMPPTVMIGMECIFLGGVNLEPSENGSSHLEPGGISFAHFIFEYLTRLAIFDMIGVLDTLPVFVYNFLPDRWAGFLDLLGVTNLGAVPLSPPAFNNVWVSSAPCYRDTEGTFRIWGAGIHWLRARMFKAIGGPKVNARRRLYIGREGATWRKVANEDLVKEVLKPYGFVGVDLTSMTPREQIELVSGAEIIVVVAGAGAVITTFAPEHCVIITLAPKAVGGYWTGLGAAMFLRQIYERVDCEHVEGGPQRINSAGVNELADIVVDTGTLLAKVEQAFKLIETNQFRDALKL